LLNLNALPVLPVSPTIIKTAKGRLKSWRKKAHRSYIHQFFRFSKEDLFTLLIFLGIKPGDVVMSHISYDRFEGFTGTLGDVIRSLQDAVGDSGSLLMPTIPFRSTALEYAQSGQITDVAKTPSHMGLITEIFRRMPGVVRSIHPTHPVAAWGRKAQEIIRDHHLAKTPCGKNTPFLRLLAHNGKILLLGTDIRVMTFFHGIEELLEPDMPFSPFTQEWFTLQTRDLEGNLVASRMRLFEPQLSRRRDLRILVPTLKNQGFWQEGHVGKLSIIVLQETQVLEACRILAKQGIYCYR
jgi:aminoglycoside 3-N-acetyltransferase